MKQTRNKPSSRKNREYIDDEIGLLQKLLNDANAETEGFTKSQLTQNLVNTDSSRSLTKLLGNLVKLNLVTLNNKHYKWKDKEVYSKFNDLRAKITYLISMYKKISESDLVEIDSSYVPIDKNKEPSEESEKSKKLNNPHLDEYIDALIDQDLNINDRFIDFITEINSVRNLSKDDLSQEDIEITIQNCQSTLHFINMDNSSKKQIVKIFQTIKFEDPVEEVAVKKIIKNIIESATK